MLDEKLAGKLKAIYKELSELSSEIASKIENIEKKGDADLITAMKKCHSAFNKTLDALEGSKELYKKDLEIRDGRNSLDYLRHDMINPISGIKGYSEMILEEDPSLEAEVNEVNSITDHMLELISHVEFH